MLKILFLSTGFYSALLVESRDGGSDVQEHDAVEHHGPDTVRVAATRPYLLLYD